MRLVERTPNQKEMETRRNGFEWSFYRVALSFLCTPKNQKKKNLPTHKKNARKRAKRNPFAEPNDNMTLIFVYTISSYLLQAHSQILRKNRWFLNLLISACEHQRSYQFNIFSLSLSLYASLRFFYLLSRFSFGALPSARFYSHKISWLKSTTWDSIESHCRAQFALNIRSQYALLLVDLQ